VKIELFAVPRHCFFSQFKDFSDYFHFGFYMIEDWSHIITSSVCTYKTLSSEKDADLWMS